MSDSLTKPNPTKFDTRFVPAKGAPSSVVMYFVGEAPGEEEAEQRKPFVGRAGQRLHEMVSTAGLNESQIRFWNTIPYRPIDKSDSGRTINRTPTEDEINLYKIFVLKDIEKVKPEKIVCVGRSAMTAFGINESVTSARSKTYDYNGMPVFVTYHPSYVERNGGVGTKSHGEVVGDLKRIWNWTKSEKSKAQGEIVDIADTKKLIEVLSKFPEDCVLDYEASGLDPLYEGFHVAGLGFCDPVTEYAVYIHVYSFERSTKNFTVPEESLKVITEFLSSHKLIVYNKQYENSVSLGVYGVYIKSVDVLAWLRCLSSGGGLKDVCSRRFGVQKWNDTIDLWNEYLGTLTKELRHTPRGNERSDVVDLNENFDNPSLASLVYTYESYVPEVMENLIKSMFKSYTEGNKEYKINKEEVVNLDAFWKSRPDLSSYMTGNNDPKFDELVNIKDSKVSIKVGVDYALDARQLRAYKAAVSLLELLNQYYNEDEIDDISQKVMAYILEKSVTGFTGSYADIPLRIIAPYALYDIVYTARLYLDVKKELQDKGLYEIAMLYDQMCELGFDIETNGIAWDDEHATRIRKAYIMSSTDNLRYLILHPRMRSILDLTQSDILKIQTAQSYEVLKTYFNPQSTTKETREAFSKLLMTPRAKFGLMLYQIHYDLQSSTLEEMKALYPVLTPLYLKILACGINMDEAKSLSDEKRNSLIVEISKKKVKYLDFYVDNVKIIQDNILKASHGSQDETQLFFKYSTYQLPTTATEEIEYHYGMYTSIMGVDIDNRDTYSDEFSILLAFRLFKKVLKSKNSYVDGDVGRGSVGVVRKSDIVNGKVAHRVRKYDESIPLKEDEQYLFLPEIGIATAATHRCQSGAHTSPWGTELMDLRTSRYEDGLCCHYDYSANEMRVIAGVAGEEKMLQAFEAGKDIHLFVASSVWGKPEKDVTSAERRFAKIASFSVLYGKGVYSLAVDNFAGDVPRAQKLFDDFYGQFPKIRNFIHDRHFEALNTGRVKTMFGNELIVGMPEEALSLPREVKEKIVFSLDGVFDKEIVLDHDRYRNKKLKSLIGAALRNSQNWPIQSSASSVAGMSMGRMSSEFKTKKLQSHLTMFTHDAGDIDTRIKHLPEILKMLPEYSIKWPRDRFGLSLAIDYEIGVSCDQLIDLEHTEVLNNKIITGFTGKQNALNKLVDRLNKYNVITEVKVEKEVHKYQSLSELFIARRGFALSMGHPFTVVEGEISMDFSKILN